MLALLVAVEMAGWSAGAVRTPSSEAAWGGVRGARGPLDVADYNLEAVLDAGRHTVEGKERLVWRNRSKEPIAAVYVHLYLNAFEGAGSTFNLERERYGEHFRSGLQAKKGEFGYIELRSVAQEGKPAAWRFVHPDGGPDTDHTVAQIDLPRPVPPGGSTVLDIDFHDQLPRVIARTGWFDKYHFVAQWFPKIGVLELPGERGATRPRWNCHEFHLHSEFYADFGSYRAEITVPSGYGFGSTGVEIGAPEETPQGTRHRIAQDAVHDFAFTAWDGYAPALEADLDSPRVHVKVLYPPEYVESGRIALRATLDSIKYFSATLGPYPHKQVTVVVPPYNALESGGMEYETLFTTFGGLGPPLLQAVRFVTVHEFGHGYFMGLLASNEFEEPFLDEGLDEFWDARMLEDSPLRVPAPGLLGWLGVSTPPMRWFDFERSGTQRFQADPIAGNSWDRWSNGSYGLVYSRTTMVFHDLEARLGTDVLARAFQEYYRRWQNRHPSTADLEAALAEVAGPQAGLVHQWFVEQVYNNSPVDDRVELPEPKEILPKPGLTTAHVELDQKQVDEEIRARRDAFAKEHPHAKDTEPGPFPWRSEVKVRRHAAQVPETLVIKFDDGTSQTLEWPAGERWHRFVFAKPVRVASAQLDPDRKILLDLDKLDDGRTRERAPLAARRWTLEFKAWVELALGILESL